MYKRNLKNINMNEAKLWFWILLNAFLVIAIITGVCFVMPAFVRYTASLPPARTITVTAQGMTTATPDMAEVSFSVVTQGQNPQDLATNNTNKMNAVLQFVKSQGIADQDITTTAYDLSPNYQYDKNTGRNFITGYTLTQTVQVKIRDLTKVATILGGLTPLGVNQVGGVNFTFQNPNSFVAIARADALRNAAMQAGEMAAEAGAPLGGVVSVQESPNIPYPRVYDAYGAGGVAASAPAPQIQPGTQDVTDSVTVTYAL